MPTEKQAYVEVSHKDLDAMADRAMLQGGGLTATLFSLVAGFMWLRRKYSSDGLEVKKEKKEGQLLDIVIAERNAAMADAREAWARRAQDAETIGKLSAQVEALNQLNHKTNNEVHLLRMLNERQAQDLLTLRQEIQSIRDQMHMCSSCPNRRVLDATQSTLHLTRVDDLGDSSTQGDSEPAG